MLNRRNFICASACCGVAVVAPSAFAQIGSAQVEGRPPLSIVPIADDVWLHTSWDLLDNGRPFPSNGLIVKGSRRLLLIDTTWRVEDMPGLLDQAAARASGLPVRLVSTHAHGDRMSGIEIARARGVSSLVYHLSQEDAPSRGLPQADATWRGAHRRIDLGARRVELFYPGPAHTRDNNVCFIEDVGILAGGCMFRAATSGIGNTADADLQVYAGSVRNVIARYGPRVRRVVPGHGDPGGPELLQHTLDLAEAAARRS
jgi:glyoxylase-like metal-dependent hydrolase (beta-lactamase superfamily II)